jgi:hypothetical protein
MSAKTTSPGFAECQMSPVVFRLAFNAGGAGGLRRDFEFVGDIGFLILVDF